MDFLHEFNRIILEQTEIALATSVDNIPNVRIVNFYYDTNNQGVIYFASFKSNPKTKEIAQNNNVALTTIPTGSTEHIRVHHAKANKSALTIYDLQAGFVKKIPSYQEIIEQAGEMLDLYEIHFNEATVTIDFMNSGKITCRN